MKNSTLSRHCLLPLAFLLISAGFLILFSFSTSPLYLNEGMDSAVFKTMGQAILQGKIPYADIFDHKGPLLYFINALGQKMIPGRVGILLLQTLSLGVSLFFLYKTARLMTSRIGSFIAVGAVLILFIGLITDGNLSEEWMLPFLSLSFFLSVRHLIVGFDSRLPGRDAFFLGFCFGAIFLLRPNDAVSFVGGLMAGLMLLELYKKRYTAFLNNTLWFSFGVAVTILPFFLYFFCHDALHDFWFGLVGFNASYSGGVKELILSCVSKGKLSLSLIFLSVLTVVYNSSHRRLLIILGPVSLFAFGLMGIRLYAHYYITILPLFCILVSCCWHPSHKSISLLALCAFLFSYQAGEGPLIKCVQSAIMSRARVMLSSQSNDKTHRFYEETDRLIGKIPLAERDSIWNYNLDWESTEPDGQSSFSMLIRHNLVQCNKVTYGANADLIREDDIRHHAPLWLLKNNRMVPLWERLYLEDPARLDYINTHYDCFARTDTSVCDIVLYRRIR